MQIFDTHRFPMPLPAGHRFPESKYKLLHDLVANSSSLRGSTELLIPVAASAAQLHLVHTADYVEAVEQGTVEASSWRRVGLPWSPELVHRCRRSVGGTVAAADAALSAGVAAHLAGGTHHAFRDRGEGYCVFNDAAVAVRVLQAQRRIGRAVVIDADVHQGNGTAAIFADDPTVFTFSIHGARNYPFRKERSDLDVVLADGTGDEGFMAAFRPALEAALQRSRADLAIYVAGADPWEGDRLGRLSLGVQGLRERDRFVFEAVQARGLPVAIVMGGGYAPQPIDTARIHLATIELACRMWSRT
ncbi:MAG: histone deacetylase [Acidobacteriota bacterium]